MNRHSRGNSQSIGHSTAEADRGYKDCFRDEMVGLKWGAWRVASCDYFCTVLAKLLVSWQGGLPAISAQAVLHWELLADRIIGLQNGHRNFLLVAHEYDELLLLLVSVHSWGFLQQSHTKYCWPMKCLLCHTIKQWINCDLKLLK